MEKEIRHLVRIANTDIEGKKAIVDAIRKIRGVGFSFANAVCVLAGVDRAKRAGELSDEEIAALNEQLKNPASAPEWMFNRRKDIESGKSQHLISSQLDFAKEQDIRMLKKMRCYRGVRHSLGLPVRGQRTRSNFRKNKGVVLGVQKKGAKRGRT